MDKCIICGADANGPICDVHQEDVVFEFTGNRPGQLKPGRFYKGSVDGFAEFGVFIDIGDHVTGLLHKSELDRRLDSLDWDTDDAVYVQVKKVHNNGNIDLAWSIRQADNEFRGKLIQTPSGDELPENSPKKEKRAVVRQTLSDKQKAKQEKDEARRKQKQAEQQTERQSEQQADQQTETETERETPDETPATPAESDEDDGVTYERVEIGTLSDHVGQKARLEGTVTGVRQTSGPTVFTVRDETGTVDAAAFVEAGVRAYPEVEVGDIVGLNGEVEMRRDELQVETEDLDILEGGERDAVEGRLKNALDARARPEAAEPLAEDEIVSALSEEIRDVATAIRRAVIEGRPVIVRHSATVDGYLTGAAIERATLPLIREEHAREDAVYHYFDRRPLQDGVYGMDDATGDVTNMLSNRDRHDEQFPLFVLAAAGSTKESLDGLELLDIYGAPKVVIDAAVADEEIAAVVDTIVNPNLADESFDANVTSTVLGANVAANVNNGVRDDLAHLPAVSFWENAPAQYVDLAAEAGYDEAATRELREAIALEAYYQSYEDKREVITDLLFGEVGGLASHIAQQFRTKLDDELETAEANLDYVDEGGVNFAVLDTDAYTNRFDFPPTELLLDEVHRRNREGEPFVTIGLADDEIHIRSTTAVDVREIAEAARLRVPNAGVTPRSAHDGKLEFLVGERDAVLDAVIATVAEKLA
ncbi:DHH family phosphoesterase [Haladaptatus sp. GCM10025707]|uniref:DHH family phosphoesterase n=1 Tax=unclassified Haladaptatus TaxID=2622732 RepID=UPI0023E7B2EA|nr:MULTISPECIES: OB-fold nucleic acid binding domain-containing protein [unclassified Haladaptatus]